MSPSWPSPRPSRPSRPSHPGHPGQPDQPGQPGQPGHPGHSGHAPRRVQAPAVCTLEGAVPPKMPTEAMRTPKVSPTRLLPPTGAVRGTLGMGAAPALPPLLLVVAGILLLPLSLGDTTLTCGPGTFGACPSYAVGYETYCYATMDKEPANITNIEGCQDDYIAMPDGWELVPYSVAVVDNVVAKYPFSTSCLVFENGTSYRGKSSIPSGSSCLPSLALASLGNAHKVTSCGLKVLMRKMSCQGRCSAGKWSNQSGLASDDQCQGCEAGRYSIAGVEQTAVTVCDKLCSPGKWSDQSGLVSDDQCQGRCSPGKWSDQSGLVSDDQCQGRCSAGKWSDQSGLVSDDQCQGRCSPGKWSVQTGLTFERQCKSCSTSTYSTAGSSMCAYFADSCPAGTHSVRVPRSACVACPAGRWSDRVGLSSNDQCQECFAGKWSDRVGLSSEDQCQECPAGKWSDRVGLSFNDQCQECSAGKWSDRAGLSSGDQCQDCSSANSSYSPAGSSTCAYTAANCPAGTYSSASSSCLNCHSGKWSNEAGLTSEIQCKGCFAGKWSDQTGLTSETQCRGRCSTGKWSDQLGLHSDSQCKLCTTGTYSVAGSISCQFFSASCPAGTYAMAPASCVKCAAGKWSNQSGLTSGDECQSLCSRGKWSNVGGLTSDVQCQGRCSKGRWSSVGGLTSNAQCEGRCSAGKWSDEVGLASDAECKNCINGKYSTIGSWGCWSTATSCPEGTYKKDPASCVECGVGKFSSLVGLTAAAGCAGICSAGRWSNRTGLVFHDQCRECSAGRWSNKTDVTSDDQCDGRCSTGKWSNQTGLFSDDQCRNCSAGTANSGTGNTVCVSCPAGRTVKTLLPLACAICAAGKFQPKNHLNSSIVCALCPLGLFIEDAAEDDTKHVKCMSCPSGRYTGVAPPYISCSVCPGGRYTADGTIASGVCLKCKAGKFNGDKGDLDLKHDQESDCNECPSGQISDVGAVFCFNCPVGWTNSSENMPEPCVQCGQGRRSSINGFMCQACEAGQYQSESGRPFCLPCLPGEFGPVAGMNNCTKCEPGKFSPLAGLKNCSECHLGLYQEDEGQASCMPCLPGEFSNETGMQSCHKCQIGKVSKVSQSTNCSVCDPGKSSDAEGSGKCFEVPPGYYVTADGIAKKCKAGFVCEGKDKDPVKPRNGSIVIGDGFASVEAPEGSKLVCDDYDNTTGGTVRLGCTRFEMCPSGKTGNTPPDATCASCPAGKTSTRGSTDCRVCAKGKFTATEGAAHCTECAKDTFQSQDTEPSVRCSECPEGYNQPKEGEASCIDLGFNLITSCPDSDRYLNDTSADPHDHKCELCPTGAACGTSDKAAWSNLGPLFGYWKIPKAERAVTADGDRNATLLWKSTTAFVKCLYPPACLGAPNRALEGRFFSEDRVDLATVRRDHIQTNNSASASICATSLGFHSQSRLCHRCNTTSRRLGTDRCTKCPDAGQNWGLMVLGFFVALFVLCFLVGDAIHDAGKQALSSAVLKILLNYLQIAALSLAFPLRWPPELESLFEFQGVVSTVGEALINPDCVTASTSAAALFYNKQAGFAAMPFIAVVVAFAFWFVYGLVKKTPFFAKRRQRSRGSLAAAAAPGAGAGEEEIPLTPKDKFVVTVTLLVYLIFPTLCAQAFRIFDCKTIAGVQYLAIDLEHPCFIDDHLIAVLTLGVGQLAVYVVGLPLLILFFLRRNRGARGGLKRRVVQVRYGLFFSAYKEKNYFWEIVLATRKIGIVAISVFGRSIGTQRQAQLALFILFISITLEIGGEPYRVATERHKVLGRLELASLFSLWGTMWCGTLIFASQASGEEGVVAFLSIMVAIINGSIMLWLVLQLVLECAVEKKESNVGKVVLKGAQSIRRMVSWKAAANTETAANPEESAIELAASSPNPLYGAKPKVADAAQPGDGWVRQFHKPTARYFLYNKATGESTWEDKEKDGWVRHFDSSSSRYYQHHRATGQTQWEAKA